MGGRGEELDMDVGVFFDGVFGGDGADGFGYGEDELVGFFCGGVVQFGSMLWVCGFDDGGAGVVGSPGETLPEFLG